MKVSAYFNADTEELAAAEIMPTGENWHKLPPVVGIVWSADQSANQMIFENLKTANYLFAPETDLPLLSEYLDQIGDYFS